MHTKTKSKSKHLQKLTSIPNLFSLQWWGRNKHPLLRDKSSEHHPQILTLTLVYPASNALSPSNSVDILLQQGWYWAGKKKKKIAYVSGFSHVFSCEIACRWPWGSPKEESRNSDLVRSLFLFLEEVRSKHLETQKGKDIFLPWLFSVCHQILGYQKITFLVAVVGEKPFITCCSPFPVAVTEYHGLGNL